MSTGFTIRKRFLALMAALVLAVSVCGDDESPVGSTVPESPSPTSASTTTTTVPTTTTIATTTVVPTTQATTIPAPNRPVDVGLLSELLACRAVGLRDTFSLLQSYLESQVSVYSTAEYDSLQAELLLLTAELGLFEVRLATATEEQLPTIKDEMDIFKWLTVWGYEVDLVGFDFFEDQPAVPATFESLPCEIGLAQYDFDAARALLTQRSSEIEPAELQVLEARSESLRADLVLLQSRLAELSPGGSGLARDELESDIELLSNQIASFALDIEYGTF